MASSGDTIYYGVVNVGGPGGFMVAAAIQRGPPLVVTDRDTIFSILGGAQWDLHPDGTRFIVSKNVGASGTDTEDEPEPERFWVVVNWFEKLRQTLGN